VRILNHVVTPYIAPCPHAHDAKSIFEQVQQLPPVLSASGLIDRAYPSALMRLIQEELLIRSNACLDHTHFYPVFQRLEITLASIEIDCSRDVFWQSIRHARVQVYRASENSYSDLHADRGSLSPWQGDYAILQKTSLCVRPPSTGAPSLKALAVQAVVRTVDDAPSQALEVIDREAELIFFLMHQRISELTEASRACRPMLWQSEAAPDREILASLARAQRLIDAVDAPRDVTTGDLLAIDRELMWASYHAGFTDLDPSTPLAEQDIAAMMAIEKVRFRLRALIE